MHDIRLLSAPHFDHDIKRLAYCTGPKETLFPPRKRVEKHAFHPKIHGFRVLHPLILSFTFDRSNGRNALKSHITHQFKN